MFVIRWKMNTHCSRTEFSCTDDGGGNLYVQLPFRCWTNRSWEQTSLSVLSGLQHRLSGTRCHKQFSSVILWLFLNLDLKLFCSIRLLLNTDPTYSQRLWSYDRMALQKFDYYYYYYYYYWSDLVIYVAIPQYRFWQISLAVIFSACCVYPNSLCVILCLHS